MRLIIDIEGNIPENPDPSSCILLTKKVALVNNNDTYLISVSCADERQEAADDMNDFFGKLPKEFLVFRNRYYMRVFRPIYALIFQIEDLMTRWEIDELILTGGSQFKFLTLIGGEGEGSYKYYKSSWLMNPFIADYFKDSLKITWKQTSKPLYLRFVHMLREYSFLFKFFKRQLILLLKKKPDIQLDPEKQKRIYAFVFLPLQVSHFRKIFTNAQLERVVFVKPSNLKILNAQTISYYPNLLDYLRAFGLFLKITYRLVPSQFVYSFNKREMRIEKAVLYRSLRFDFIEFYSITAALEKVVKTEQVRTDGFLVSNTTFGQRAVLLHEFAKKIKVPHYNFQAVTMAKMLFPQMKLADKFFLYSHHTYNLYKEKEPSYHYYLPVKKIDGDIRLKNEAFLTLGLFTQPDSYTDRYLSFLRSILPLLNQAGGKVKLLIKPHYRQDRFVEFENLAKGHSHIVIEDPGTLAHEVMEKADFMLSMTSSVLFEAIQLNCPGIIIDFDGLDNKIINEICFPEINYIIKSPAELTKIINEPQHYINNYLARRDDFIKQYEGTNITEVFDHD